MAFQTGYRTTEQTDSGSLASADQVARSGQDMPPRCVYL